MNKIRLWERLGEDLNKISGITIGLKTGPSANLAGMNIALSDLQKATNSLLYVRDLLERDIKFEQENQGK